MQVIDPSVEFSFKFVSASTWGYTRDKEMRSIPLLSRFLVSVVQKKAKQKLAQNTLKAMQTFVLKHAFRSYNWYSTKTFLEICFKLEMCP